MPGHVERNSHFSVSNRLILLSSTGVFISCQHNSLNIDIIKMLDQIKGRNRERDRLKLYIAALNLDKSNFTYHNLVEEVKLKKKYRKMELKETRMLKNETLGRLRLLHNRLQSQNWTMRS